MKQLFSANYNTKTTIFYLKRTTFVVYLLMEVIIILLLVLLNGFFAMAEIAIVSSRKTKLAEKAKKGSKGAATALKLLEHPENFLSTMQIGITLIGVISGMFGGVALAEKIAPFIAQYEPLADYAYQVSLALTVTLITYLSLVVGELIPKTLGLINPEGLAVMFAPAVSILAAITRPLTVLLGLSTKLSLKILGVEQKQEDPVSEEEMKMIIEQGVQHGVIEQKENEMIRGIFRFADRKAYSLMTSRRDVFWIDINESFDDIKKELLESPHTKIPVCDGSLDNVIGVILTRTFISRLLNEPVFDIHELLMPAIFVPETALALKILETFKHHKVYICIVVDEFGVTTGLITLHDLIENIFGELPQLDDEPEDQLIIRREDGSMLVDGSIQIDDLREIINLPEFDENETSGEFTTLAGLAIYILKKVPQTGEIFEVGDYVFEIIDMDFNRVDKVLVSKKKPNGK